MIQEMCKYYLEEMNALQILIYHEAKAFLRSNAAIDADRGQV
jgi:hypothetical protein